MIMGESKSKKKTTRSEIFNRVLGWVKNTTLPADKIAKHFGLKTEYVQKICDEVREWPQQ